MIERHATRYGPSNNRKNRICDVCGAKIPDSNPAGGLISIERTNTRGDHKAWYCSYTCSCNDDEKNKKVQGDNENR